jgi:hypothetical protein
MIPQLYTAKNTPTVLAFLSQGSVKTLLELQLKSSNFSLFLNLNLSVYELIAVFF